MRLIPLVLAATIATGLCGFVDDSYWSGGPRWLGIPDTLHIYQGHPFEMIFMSRDTFVVVVERSK